MSNVIRMNGVDMDVSRMDSDQLQVIQQMMMHRQFELVSQEVQVLKERQQMSEKRVELQLGDFESKMSDFQTEVRREVEVVKKNERLDYHEAAKVKKAVERRVREVACRDDIQQLLFDEIGDVKPDLDVIKRKLYPKIWRDVKDTFGVASYRDIRRLDMEEAIRIIEVWRPRVL